MPHAFLPASPLAFSKMHGLGNDFMVIDATTQPFTLCSSDISQLAHRQFGVGFDQLLVVEPSPAPDIDFGYRIFNADGSEVEQCGNGARCFARFVRAKGLTDKRLIRVATASGVIQLQVQEDEQVQVNMGVPKFAPAQIPFLADTEQLGYDVEVLGQAVRLSVANMGNPHAVLRVEDVEHCAIATLGPALERHARFPKRVNVGFMQVLSRREIKLRVYERGTGETLACGTGACAAVVTGQCNGWLDKQVTVHLPGGTLAINWAGEGQPIQMTGPAQFCYEGVWYGFGVDKVPA